MYIGRMAAGPQHARCCPRVVLMEGLKVRPHPPERGPMQLPLAEGGSIGAHVTRAGGILYVHTQQVPLHWEGQLGIQTMALGPTPASRYGWDGLRAGSACLCRHGGVGLVVWPVWWVPPPVV